ncbi:unnamed protein product, partial [Ectocarpus sp. 12 AP-2014]
VKRLFYHEQAINRATRAVSVRFVPKNDGSQRSHASIVPAPARRACYQRQPKGGARARSALKNDSVQHQRKLIVPGKRAPD